MMKRRSVVAGLMAGGLGALMGGRIAVAVEAGAAQAYVRSTVEGLLEIVQGSGGAASKAAKLKSLMESRAAMPQIARFSAGAAWRDMSDDQQDRFAAAFSHFLATVYARRFQSYAGQTVTVGDVVDESRKGALVVSTVSQTDGAPIRVEWLVSDRGGAVKIADIIIEGVSLVLTQRDEISGMLNARGGDVEKLIADLAAA